MKNLLAVVTCLSLFVMASVAQAELLSKYDDSYRFVLTSSKDPKASDYWGGFEILVSKGENNTVDFTFDFVDGYESFGGGKNGQAKILNGSWKIWGNELGDYLLTSSFQTGNQEWTPIFKNAGLVDGITWDAFAAYITDSGSNFYMQAHIQAVTGGDVNSINAGNFTWVLEPPGPPAATPEPASMLIFGIGLAGIGGLRCTRPKVKKT